MGLAAERHALLLKLCAGILQRSAFSITRNWPIISPAVDKGSPGSVRKRADFLRSFGLATLPENSIIYTRAGEMLLAQDRPKLALTAVDKALLANPTDLAAHRLRPKVLDAMPR
jgi:hypothetical protein